MGGADWPSPRDPSLAGLGCTAPALRLTLYALAAIHPFVPVSCHPAVSIPDTSPVGSSSFFPVVLALCLAMTVMMSSPSVAGIGAAGLASRAGVIFRAMLRSVTPPLPSSTRAAAGGPVSCGRNVSVRYGNGSAVAFLGAIAAGGATAASADVAVVAAEPSYAYTSKDTYTPTVELQTEVHKSFWGPIGEQVSFGCALGIATGFCLRKLGRMLMVVVGGEVLVLQYMSHRGWASVSWDKMSRDMSPALDGSRFRHSIGLLAYKMPFASAFTGAFGWRVGWYGSRTGGDTLSGIAAWQSLLSQGCTTMEALVLTHCAHWFGFWLLSASVLFFRGRLYRAAPQQVTEVLATIVAHVFVFIFVLVCRVSCGAVHRCSAGAS